MRTGTGMGKSTAPPLFAWAAAADLPFDPCRRVTGRVVRQTPPFRFSRLESRNTLQDLSLRKNPAGSSWVPIPP